MATNGIVKKLRVGALSLVLLAVALNTWLDRLYATDWEKPLRVLLYPINGDGSLASGRYISALTERELAPIEEFFRRQISLYGHRIREPVDIKLAPPLDDLPPELPTDGHPLKVMLWSLQMRYWAWRLEEYDGPRPEVRLFVKYYDPGVYKRLSHSVGLEKGMIGVIKAYAHRKLNARNNVVIAHELLHTLGATDKYDPRTNLPYHPHGYAAPQQHPRYPQQKAEIMGGRVPVSPVKAEMPAGLHETVVGPKTAQEIAWTSS